jgi:hypothetical protein
MAAAPDCAVPDYRQRLAFGTDQGRWLMQQQAAAKPLGSSAQGTAAAPRRRVPPLRAYHELDDGVGAVLSSPVVRTRSHSGGQAGGAPAMVLYILVAMVALVAIGGMLAVGRAVLSADRAGGAWIHPDAAGP